MDRTGPDRDGKVAVEPRQAPPALVTEAGVGETNTDPAEIADEVALPDELADQPTAVLADQPTIVLEPCILTLSRDTPTRAAPRPLTWASLRDHLSALRRVPGAAERIVAPRPWLWVLALLACVCILALLSHQLGG